MPETHMINKVACVILTMTIPSMAGCRGVNTKIGWPTQFLGTGGWTLVCYLAAWLLILVAVLVMKETSKRREGGPLLSIVVILAIAAFLLQWLPRTESGIQFLPISPWTYSGWISFCISLLCWMFIMVAALVAATRCLDSPGVCSAAFLVAMSLNALLSFSDWKEDGSPQLPEEQQVAAKDIESPEVLREDETDYGAKVQAWHQRVSKLRVILHRLQSEQSGLKISEAKTRESDKSERVALLEETIELDSQIAMVEHELEVLETAIRKAESRLRRIGRHELLHEAAIASDAEYKTICQIERELQEELRDCQNDFPR